jgi:DNA invertase Pin-like site-specific DNA recombinase
MERNDMASRKTTRQNSLAKLILAVAYIRMSSGKQEASPEQQRAEIKKLAAEHGYKIVREYFDAGISGYDGKSRPQFRQMIDDAASGDFAVILCRDQSRFGRFDPVEANYYWHILRQAGVSVHLAAEGRIETDDLGDWLKASVEQHAKRQYIKDLARNSLGGIVQKLGNGVLLIGSPPYAMDKVSTDPHGNQHRFTRHEKSVTPREWTSTLVPAADEHEVRTVRRLYERYAAGAKGLRAIADDLNGEGVPSPSGGIWHATVIRDLLKKPCYCGDYAFGRQVKAKFFRFAKGGAQQHKPNGRTTEYRDEADWHVVRDVFEPVVPRDLWDRCNRRLTENRKRTSPAKGNFYYLTHMLKCGHCGAWMHGRRRTNGTRPIIYICSTYNTAAACNAHAVKQDDLIRFLVAKIQRTFVPGGNVERLRDRIAEELKTRKPADDEAKRLTKLDRDVERAVGRAARCEDDAVAEMLLKEVTTMRRERDEIQKQVDRSATATPNVPDVAVIMRWLEKLNADIQSKDPERLRDVFQNMVSRIELHFGLVKGNKRDRYPFERGTVFLRENAVFGSPDLYATHPR